MTKSSNSQQHLFHEFCQRHLNMVSEFHDLQSHYAEHQKQLLLKELQLFCHYVTEADLYSDFKDVLETSMGSSRFNDPFFIPILQKLQYQQSELHQLEV
ncbi:hypothetical protein HMI55_004813 [Coelomomyces lativittatus]|nr:hypothetical protein HMI55_004813 [Coelomomyces lativittatus]